MAKPPDLKYGPGGKGAQGVGTKKQRAAITDIADAVKKYPVGAAVRLTSDLPDYKPRTVQGYKQIGKTVYLIFSDGNCACVEKVSNGMPGRKECLWNG